MEQQVQIHSYKNPQRNPGSFLDKSVQYPRNASSYVIPDLQNSVRIEYQAENEHGNPERTAMTHSPILWELKRGPHRSTTDEDGRPKNQNAVAEIPKQVRATR